MNTLRTPPYIVIKSSKEVIFYLSKKYNSSVDINSYIKELNLTDYKVMIINSKCIFNRLKNENFN